ncbi:Down syndrome cell adhesion molecule homolog isoform X1 [Dermacentor silvarum]|uniref:Down syndrome cell adhesion molecule homolog isoform X1 n=1 Tax=Dermacentor silvarum TaxID=543639 RepID=UPI00189C35BC|nr:Down syndrome cell adhesion molecule homolog isoform X1 [Dermacentor silvarum]XP_049514457.1 Down syndrome cell adhesion molecule homolog isoform X2 [Dermacentor silvarum]XP_049514461.1 Down syndrome cell adhesion molecule homolog isoform X1 [Dermacentor silvarum]XP_049514463.1 Down syndrome cell adhesion molecule homolog isoform X1 [Dermacentor silvarum]
MMRRDRPLSLIGAAACVLLEMLRSVAAMGDGSVGSLSATLVGPDTAVLSWMQPTKGADGYELRVMRGSALVFAQRFRLDAAEKLEPVLYYRLTGLRPATTYNVSLVPTLAGQQGPITSVVFTTAPLVSPTTPATASTPQSVLNGPTSIQALPLSSTSVLISWGPLAPYVVGGQYRVRVRDAGTSQRFLDVGYVLSAIVQDLDPTENYTLSVQWCPSQNVCSPFVSTTRVANAPKLPVPSNLTVVDVGPMSINVTWQLPGNSTNITGYQVSWCISDLCIGKLNDLTTKTFYSVQRLQDFKNYTVFVCAYLDRGLTTFVGQCINVSAKTEPGAPIGGVAIPLSQSSILLLWAAKPGCPSISEYQLRVASPTPTVNWASTELTQYTFANLVTKTKYTFQLRWCPLPGTCSEAVNITGSTV